MKWITIVLAVALLTLSAWFYSIKQQADKDLAATQGELTTTRTELQTTRSDLTTAQTKLTATTTELDATKAKLSEQEKAISQLTGEKNQAVEKLGSLGGEVVVLMDEVQQQKARTKLLEEVSMTLSGQLRQVSAQLGDVRLQYGQLEKAHTETLGHLTALRADYVTLTKEHDALEEKFNDLAALRLQIATVKRGLEEARIAERRRLDQAATLSGNGGFLLKDGQWQNVIGTETNAFPLIEDIRRPK